MSTRSRWLLSGLGVVVLLWLLWTIIHSFWLTPVGTLRAQAAKLENRISEYREALSNAGVVHDGIDEYVARTLGGSLEEVDHRLRSRLNRLGETVGLKGMSVGTGRSVALLSPGRSDFKGASRRSLREEVDFVEVEGTISGTTNWSGVIELLDRLKAAPWIKKIDQVRLRASGDGTRLQVTVRLRTLFIPGQVPTVEPESTWTKDRLVGMADLVSRSPFVIPTVPAPKPSGKPATPTNREPAGWQLTGVAGIGDQAEAWIRNTKSGRTRRLLVGQRHGQLVLEGIKGDLASFRNGDSVVSIQVGQLLHDTPTVHK
ncbi:MAG: hypothetical protein VX527_11010 [Planctomycetota bacterium]|nr:hypothetical protein [Planctomycetota bacterium]